MGNCTETSIIARTQFLCTKTLSIMTLIHKKLDLILHSKHDNLPFGVDAFYPNDSLHKPVIIFIHGFNGFKDWGHFNRIAEESARRGFTFVKCNLSHNGTTPERPTEFVNLKAYGKDHFSTDLDDIGLLINYLHTEKCPFKAHLDLNRIFLIGHSRGGALAILKAGEEPRIKGIATWASIISTLHFWTPANIKEVKEKGVVYVKNGRTGQNLPLYLSYYEDALYNVERLNVKQKIKNLSIPVLVAHGNADTSIPVDFADQLQNWQPKAEKLIIEGANHTFGGSHPFEQENLPEHSAFLLDKTLDFFDQIKD